MSTQEGSPACPLPCRCAFAEACDPQRFAPCTALKKAHARKQELCDELEAIADGLPSSSDRLQCLHVAAELVPLLRECHRIEEEIIFPAYERTTGPTELSTRLRMEHLQDLCAAEDISEILLAYGHEETIAQAEAFGYMMRGLFESLRRHMILERHCMLPPATAANRTEWLMLPPARRAGTGHQRSPVADSRSG